jgi:hypothetical protein
VDGDGGENIQLYRGEDGTRGQDAVVGAERGVVSLGQVTLGVVAVRRAVCVHVSAVLRDSGKR